MNLRCRGYHLEADYERDRRFRQCALDFYTGLIKVIRHKPSLLNPRSDGGFNLLAKDFWKHPRARSLVVIFLPGKQSFRKSGVGRAGIVDAVIFPVMKGPGDIEHLDLLIDRDAVVHEIIHLLDPGYKKTRGIGRYYANGKPSADELRVSKYYNDPLEWNAFWNEGANRVETVMNTKVIGNPSAYAFFFGDGTLRDFQKKVGYYWDKSFLANMNPRTRRRFDKRLSQLWKAMGRGNGLPS